MCGINGFIGSIKNPHDVIERMNARTKHRGPDSTNEHISDWFGLGHNRLSIIDTSSAANQPISNSNGHLVFNGEIYNWRELAHKYKLSGNNLTSDSHLLSTLLANIGIEKTISEIRGIYAFAWVDTRNFTVNLVRDKFGTKPLYLFYDSSAIYFSSEIKAFSGLENWKPKMNHDALQSYLTFQNQFDDQTLYSNVKMVDPGTWIEFGRNGSCKKYLNGLDLNNIECQDTEFLELLDSALVTAIERNLRADVEIGSFLSGGIDSSLIASYIRDSGISLDTFTIGFNLDGASELERNFDETKTAKHISELLKTQHHQSIISEMDMAQAIDHVSWAVEDPRVGQSYPNMYAAELAARKVKVCIAGTGGDEIFGGYPWRYSPVIAADTPQGQLSNLLKIWHRLGTSQQISALLGIDQNAQVDFSKKAISKKFHEKQLGVDRIELRDVLRFEQQTFLHGLLLVEDKLSMKYSLEVRVPFLDEDLVKVAANTPSTYLYSGSSEILDENKLNNYSYKETQKEVGKIALRLLTKKKLPNIYNLRKQGFSSPDATWFRQDKQSLLTERLLNKNCNLWEFLDYGTAKQMVEDHKNAKANHRLLIWSLLTLESTVRQFQIGL